MGLIGDLNEAKTFWSNASWPFKIAIVLAAFLTTSSVASIADSIFHWKGFILDGINFYKNWISSPVSELFKNYGILLNKKSVDLLILLCLYFTGLIRASIVTGGKLWVFILLPLYAILTLIVGYMLKGIDTDPSIWAYASFIGIYCLTPIVYRFDKVGKFSKEEVLSYYLPGTVAIIVILLLGAINAGLTRTVV